jgi:hypothetical protein
VNIIRTVQMQVVAATTFKDEPIFSLLTIEKLIYN